MEDQIYSILIVADITPDKKAFIDTIRHNLLGTPHASDDTWKVLPKSETIRVSIVDVVDTVEKAQESLKSGSFDVVICDHNVNKKSIGGGTLDTFRNLNKNAIFIMLLSPQQKKGSVMRDGKPNVGRLVKNLYDKGFYNAIYKNRVDINMLIRMIKSGGFAKEWAKDNYGLNDKTDDQFVQAALPDLQQAPDPIESHNPTRSKNFFDNPNASLGFSDAVASLAPATTSKNQRDDQRSAAQQGTTQKHLPTGENKSNKPNKEVTSMQQHKQNQETSTPALPVPLGNSSPIGYYPARVSFVQNTTVILETKDPIPADIMGTTIFIPYIKK